MDQSDLHIEDFHKDCVRILSALYQSFPRPLTLYVEDISGPDRVDEFGLHSPRHEACLAAMLWLAEEGWIRYADVIRREAIDQAVLTARTFTALVQPVSATPVPVDADIPESERVLRQSRIHVLRAALRNRAMPRIRHVMQELLEALAA
jgi:hypothetical protein